MFELGFKLLLSYLLGSVSGALLIGRLRGGVDIRLTGSGNAGGTNALRSQGPGFALWTVIIDIGKGALAATLIAAIALPGVAIDPALPRDWLAPLCGVAAVIGHCYPLYYQFRGGKGAATVVGVFAVLAPDVLAPLLLTWLLTLTLTGFVGLATMLAGVATVAYLGLVRHGPMDIPLLAFATAMAFFLIYTHRQNLVRMRDGTENRARSLMLFGRHK